MSTVGTGCPSGTILIQRNSALLGWGLASQSFYGGTLDCFQHSWMGCQQIFVRRWRMQCDSFNVPLCARLVSQREFLLLVRDGSSQSTSNGQLSIPFLCVMFSLSLHLSEWYRSVLNWPCVSLWGSRCAKGQPFFSPHFSLHSRGTFSSYLLLQTEKVVGGLLQVRFLFKVGSAHGPIHTCAAFCPARQPFCTGPAGMQIGIVSTQHLQGFQLW